MGAGGVAVSGRPAGHARLGELLPRHARAAVADEGWRIGPNAPTLIARWEAWRKRGGRRQGDATEGDALRRMEPVWTGVGFRDLGIDPVQTVNGTMVPLLSWRGPAQRYLVLESARSARGPHAWTTGVMPVATGRRRPWVVPMMTPEGPNTPAHTVRALAGLWGLPDAKPVHVFWYAAAMLGSREVRWGNRKNADHWLPITASPEKAAMALQVGRAMANYIPQRHGTGRQVTRWCGPPKPLPWGEWTYDDYSATLHFRRGPTLANLSKEVWEWEDRDGRVLERVLGRYTQDECEGRELGEITRQEGAGRVALMIQSLADEMVVRVSHCKAATQLRQLILDGSLAETG